MNPEHIARVIYEANRAYCATLGDNSQPEWRDASEPQRDTLLKGIEFVLANPNASASAQHDSWWQVKRDAGWTYGPVNDASKQEHPCCVPYDELPLEQQRKDDLFRAIVLSLSGVPLYTAQGVNALSSGEPNGPTSDAGATVVVTHDAGGTTPQGGGEPPAFVPTETQPLPPEMTEPVAWTDEDHAKAGITPPADATPEQAEEVAEIVKSFYTETPSDPSDPTPETPSDEEPLV